MTKQRVLLVFFVGGQRGGGEFIIFDDILFKDFLLKIVIISIGVPAMWYHALVCAANSQVAESGNKLTKQLC